MAEELTSSAIQELANATNNVANAIKFSNSPVETYLIALIPAITAMVGIFVTIWIFNIKTAKENEIQKKYK